ncbi:hypothetical protein JQX13_38805 [Archangium violaceum]|uniref:hypothetical protein n=1 Tax=Archangium violaceum TaxID=83451 RepID=UPI00193BDC2B|nr:hypothetical protein [Archangium violaceum]QRK06034.1 hypothetical protein JQX13_38805 [Archangium violaceum]
MWQAFGDVANYVEPFAGSLAVLLARPTPPRVETVNDKDCYLANFWRAVHADPEGVAHHSDWPVNEADLHARHRWLVEQVSFRERMRREPDFYDVKVAGWWVWGISQWIGSGWCAQPAWEEQDAAGAEKTCGIHTAEYSKRPALDKPGRGVHQLATRGESLANAVNWEGRSNAGRAARGVHARHAQDERLRMLRSAVGLERRPHLSSGNGIHASRVRDLSLSADWAKRPSIGDGGARGVHTAASSTWQQMPAISGSRGATGRGVVASGSRGTILEWMQALSARLRYVRVCCGDWRRVLTPSVTEAIGITAVFLDPPYSAAAGRDPSLYAEEDLGVAHHVREWALANGDNPRLRIALCGYEGEHQMPDNWRCVAWKAPGGYAASAGNTANAQRERIWFSPHCLAERQPTLMDLMEVSR